ncbi:radical SAM protein [uncultured Desulfovibrio sp.]|uniref:radical SAM protein n=1 Tax=uncultured Desulfovibrio sp. TaxID=167968 RepID=UPI002621C630|nr:radical SAM protein [uncultured Desulfovibrio sp.]
MPKILCVETSSRCNLDCEMCPRKSFHSAGRIMDDATFRKVLAVFETVPVEYAYLTGYGEPLLDKDIFARAEAVHKISPSTGIGFTTNGLLLNRENIARIISSCLSGITISLDAGTRETYAAIRGRDAFVTVMQNLRQLSEERGNKALSVNAVITRKNLAEMEEIVLRCLELSIPTLNFSPMCIYSTADQLKLFVERSLITAEYLRLREKYEQRILLTAWNLDNEKKYGNCWGEIPEMLEIDCDGNVYPCCVHRSQAPRYSPDGRREDGFVRLGTVNDDSFDAIAGSPALQELLDAFENGDIPAQCANCFLARAFSKKELIRDNALMQRELDDARLIFSQEKQRLTTKLGETAKALNDIRHSRSWACTRPLRAVAGLLRGLRGVNR